MKTKTIVLLLNLSLIFLAASLARAQNSFFTYQGRLTDKGSPANGIYDLQFILRDGDKNPIGNPAGASGVGITNGLFTVLLDFGTEAFDGSPRWLEIALRRNEPPGPPPEFVTLSPRQPITVAPYALQAATASGLSATGIQPLNFFVNNSRALRLEPTTNSPNIIGGFSGNYAAPGVVGAMIGGGGSSSLFGSPSTNRVESNYGSIAGGTGNTIQTNSANSTVGGGARNAIGPNADSATIAGGDFNEIRAEGVWAFIGGGQRNVIEGWTPQATIAGGYGNYIGSANSTIGGGLQNRIGTNALSSVIGGGQENAIQTNNRGGTIAGGFNNNIFTESAYTFIGGGNNNSIGPNTSMATVAGGDGNIIFSGGLAASIGGGHENFVGTNAAYASIPGGRGAIARSFGQRVYANGTFFNYFSGDPNNAGSAQSSLFVARIPTTNSAPTELLLDGDSGQAQGGTGRMLVSRNATWFFDAIVVARSSTGDSAGFQIKNTIKNVNGTTSLIGLPNVSRFASDPSTSTWNVTVEADDANDALVIKVTGADNTTIRWVASVRTVEVIF